MYFIAIKSIYAEPTDTDGFRVLVDDRLPSGVTVEGAEIHLWLGQIAPSPRLQKWYRQDREKWPDFVTRYYAELDNNAEALMTLFNEVVAEKITLLFTAKDAKCNTAVALKAYLEGVAE